MRFCRRCGNATGLLSVTEEPTRPLQSEAEAGASGGMTGAYPSPGVYPAPVPPVHRRRRIWPWFLGGFLALSLGAAAAVGLFLTGMRDHFPTSIQVSDEGTRITTSKGDQIIIPSDTETAGDMRTVRSETFPLNEGDELVMKNLLGGISISTWNESRGEIKLIRHGIDIGDKSSVNIKVSRSGSKVEISAEWPERAPPQADYELRIPRGVLASSIETIARPIQISGVEGPVSAKSVGGDIRIEAAAGGVTAKTMSGDVLVMVDRLDRRAPIELRSASGDVQLRVKKDFNADVDLKSVSGEIAIDPSLGLATTRKAAVREARGRVGAGGSPVSVETISGNIKVSTEAATDRRR
ncbi:MAG: DUF4097 family beta strand repeat protein [Acidobacteria bacterium]|nr:DUF4097 family beta strand repeat protein [Acidobacteriota bacterium]